MTHRGIVEKTIQRGIVTDKWGPLEKLTGEKG